MANLFWAQVSCARKHLLKIVCSVPLSKMFSAVTSTTENPHIFCSAGSILKKNSSCHQFDWKTLNEARSLSCRLPQHVLQVFSAIRVTSLPLITKHKRIAMFMRYFDTTMIDHFHGNKISEGFCVSQLRPVQFIVAENVFECSNGAFISPAYICDGKIDCARDSVSDESHCNCKLTDPITKTCQYYNSTEGKLLCSPLFNRTRNSHCAVVQSGQALKSEVVDIVRMKTTESLQKCPQNQIPCSENHNKCYNISCICTYNLIDSEYLIPCENGEHMQQCDAFICNKMFKCPGYYCVPWKFVCNGKWDCPGGYDESTEHNCSPNRNCTNFFKCRNDVACVHPGNVCDDNVDCPLGDDEHFCILKTIICPKVCACLTHAIMCVNLSITKLDLGWPFTIIYLQHSTISLNSLNPCEFYSISVTHSHTQKICQLFARCYTTQVINVAFNSIERIEFECFSQKKVSSMKAIDVSNNLVKTLDRYSFLSLRFLTYLNFSSNPLLEIAFEALSSVPQLRLISIKNVSVKITHDFVFQDLNITYLETSGHQMCCLAPVTASCSVSLPWYFSCTDILINSDIVIAFGVVSWSVLIANMASVILQKTKKVKSSDQSNVFNSLVLSINFCDLSLFLPLLGLWVCNFVYKGRFAFQASDWTSSVFCYLIFASSLNFNFLSPTLLSFYSLSRFLVVESPLDTKMKDTRFVVKLVVGMVVISLFLTCVFTLLTWMTQMYFVEGSALMTICSPFVDPSDKILVVKIITCLTALQQIICIIFISTVYIKLVLSLQKSRKTVQHAVSKQKSIIPLVIQIIIITGSNVVCWIPAAVVYVISMLLQNLLQVVFWITIAVGPTNSIVNPLVFISFHLRK